MFFIFSFNKATFNKSFVGVDVLGVDVGIHFRFHITAELDGG